MAKNDKEFQKYVMDLFVDIPEVSSRPMFGGYGIYKNGVIFAIIADGQLFFKADEPTENDFRKHHSMPFTYNMPNGKELTMSYWLLPATVMEDREMLPI